MHTKIKRLSGYTASVLCALFVVIAVMLSLRFYAAQPVSTPSPALTDGLNYLSRREQADYTKVDRIFRQRQEERLAARQQAEQRARLIADLEHDAVNVWPLFDDYVILGDSRAVGFSYYHFLEYRRVLADGGNTIRSIAERIPAMKNLNPSYIYICYGLNDTGIGFWKEGEPYAAEMLQILNGLREEFPNAKIIVSSILPATPEAISHSPAWGRIPAFSAAVETMCAENGFIFVNNDALCAAYMDTQWQPDGVHLRKSFYPYWAKNLMLAALRDGEVETE